MMKPSAKLLADIAAAGSYYEAREVIEATAGYVLLGSGCYGAAYLQPDGSVFKLAYQADGTKDYIEWCHRIFNTYGAGHRLLDNLPEVYHFHDYATPEESNKGWWAVMPCYEDAGTEYMKQFGWNLPVYPTIGEGRTKTRTEVLCVVDRVADLLAYFLRPGTDYLDHDIHHHNIMWDPRRKQWVVTDPLADSSTGSGSTAPMPQGEALPRVSHV